MSFSDSAATSDGYGSMSLLSMPEYVNSIVTLTWCSRLSRSMSSGFIWCQEVNTTR